MFRAEDGISSVGNKIIRNHTGGVGELGAQIVNHSVTQEGTIGSTLINHALDDAAPRKEHFVKKITESQLAKVLGLKPYASRALSISNQGDVIQLPPELALGWNQICEHYRQVGLEGKHATNVLWDNDFAQAIAPEYSKLPLDTFFFGNQAHLVRPDENRLAITKKMNDKGCFLKLAQSLGVKIPKCLFFETKEQFECSTEMRFPLVFKINKSVAGLGTKVCESIEDLEDCVNNINSGIGFHLQAYLGEDSQFISAQYVLENGKARFITATCNFIGGKTSHEGNWGGKLFKSRFLEDPNVLVYPIADAIAKMGGKGWMGIDIGVTIDGRMFPIEANLRYTAAAYYFLTAQKLGMENRLWAGRSYKSSKRLAELDLGKIAYNPKKGRGWVLTNWGPMIDGNGGGFLYLGRPEVDLYHDEEDKLKKFLA
jgi:hypothetical protein